jgi:sugar (pentulose or hexulose) kinase
MMWQDTRPHTICRELAAQAGLEADVYQRAGTRILSVFSAPKIMWIARNEPAIAAAATRYVGVQDIVLHTLTGRFVTDRTFAGRSLLYNVHTGDWDNTLLDMFHVRRSALSDLVNPGDFVGEITKDVVERTGLPPGTPVITAGGDQQCAALGMGLFDTDRLVINTGTGSYVLGLAHAPQTDSAMRFFSNPAATEGHFTVEASLPTTGSAYRWLNRTMFNRSDPDDFSMINEAALSAPAGAHGAHLVPHLQGSGTPHWNSDATGTLSGITLATSPEDIARAMLEGIAEEIAGAVRVVVEQTGAPTTITSSGGLASFPLFTSILESRIGMPLHVPAITESTSRGAWAVAANSLGWYSTPAAALAASQ